MGLPLYKTKPALKAALLREFADPRMNASKMARRHRRSVFTILRWREQLKVKPLRNRIEQMKVSLLQLGVYKSTPEKIARVRELCSNPKNTTGKICKMAHITHATLQSWRKRFRIPVARVQKQLKHHRQKITRFRAAAKIKGMTWKALQSRFHFSDRLSMKQFAKNARIGISRLPKEPPKPKKKLCKRCHHAPQRARGYCRNCFEWARREGKIDNGRKCPKCRRFRYGKKRKCWKHLHSSRRRRKLQKVSNV